MTFEGAMGTVASPLGGLDVGSSGTVVFEAAAETKVSGTIGLTSRGDVVIRAAVSGDLGVTVETGTDGSGGVDVETGGSLAASGAGGGHRRHHRAEFG